MNLFSTTLALILYLSSFNSDPIKVLKICTEYKVGEGEFVVSCKAKNPQNCSDGVVLTFDNIGSVAIDFSVFGIDDEALGVGTSFELLDEAIYRVEVKTHDVEHIYYYELDFPSAGTLVNISPVIFKPRPKG